MNKKVMIVEDEPLLLNMLDKFCEMSGVETTLYENGFHAMKAIKTETEVNVAIIDLELPDCSGLDVAKVIKKENKDIYVVLSSGDENALKTEADENPLLINEILSKPYSLESIKKILSDFK